MKQWNLFRKYDNSLSSENSNIGIGKITVEEVDGLTLNEHNIRDIVLELLSDRTYLDEDTIKGLKKIEKLVRPDSVDCFDCEHNE